MKKELNEAMEAFEKAEAILGEKQMPVSYADIAMIVALLPLLESLLEVVKIATNDKWDARIDKFIAILEKLRGKVKDFELSE